MKAEIQNLHSGPTVVLKAESTVESEVLAEMIVRGVVVSQVEPHVSVDRPVLWVQLSAGKKE